MSTIKVTKKSKLEVMYDQCLDYIMYFEDLLFDSADRDDREYAIEKLNVYLERANKISALLEERK